MGFMVMTPQPCDTLEFQPGTGFATRKSLCWKTWPQIASPLADNLRGPRFGWPRLAESAKLLEGLSSCVLSRGVQETPAPKQR